MTRPPIADQINFPMYANARQYDAEWDRLMLQGALHNRPGILPNTLPPWRNLSDLSENGPGSPNDVIVVTAVNALDVNIAVGRFVLSGTSRANQGMYLGINAEVQTVTAPTADAVNPRIDLVIVRALDADVSGSLTKFEYTVIPGTPTPGATRANLAGAPALPDDSLALAYLEVTATFTGPFLSSDIRDARNISCPAGTLIAKAEITGNDTISTTVEEAIVGLRIENMLPASATHRLGYVNQRCQNIGVLGTLIIRLRDSALVGGGTIHGASTRYASFASDFISHDFSVPGIVLARQDDGLLDAAPFALAGTGGWLIGPVSHHIGIWSE